MTTVDPTAVRLAAGSHSDPGLGVCALELASMLAGEEFSDRPECVCPVIAAFVRAWNDRVKHRDRQGLRPFCPRMVGSRGDRRATAERREHLLRWIEEVEGRGPGAEVSDASSPGARDAASGWQRLRTWARIGVQCGLAALVKRNEGVGEYAARLAFGRRDDAAFFALLDELLAPDADEGPAEPPEIAPSPPWMSPALGGQLAQPALPKEWRRDPHRHPMPEGGGPRRLDLDAECGEDPARERCPIELGF